MLERNVAFVVNERKRLLTTIKVQCLVRMRHMMSAMTCFVSLLIFPLHSFAAQTSAAPSAPTVDSLCLSEVLISAPQPSNPAETAAAERKADSAREAIRQGAKFEDIAKKNSDGPSASLGGALGLFKRGQLAKSIEDRVFAMKVGDVSDVIRTRQGFTLLKVVECGGLMTGDFEVLSGTQGIDFGPYVQLIRKKVEPNWYHQVPLSGETKKGEVTIEVAITTDGKLTNIRLAASSGDEVLDRAALEGLTQSSPFPPLPSQYTGPPITLRLHFLYNPGKSSLN
jgi:TonB family protein